MSDNLARQQLFAAIRKRRTSIEPEEYCAATTDVQAALESVATEVEASKVPPAATVEDARTAVNAIKATVDAAFATADKDREVPADELKKREKAQKSFAAVNQNLEDGDVQEALAALGGALMMVGTILVGIPATAAVGAGFIAASLVCAAAVEALAENAALNKMVNSVFVSACNSVSNMLKKLTGQVVEKDEADKVNNIAKEETKGEKKADDNDEDTAKTKSK